MASSTSSVTNSTLISLYETEIEGALESCQFTTQIFKEIIAFLFQLQRNVSASLNTFKFIKLAPMDAVSETDVARMNASIMRDQLIQGPHLAPYFPFEEFRSLQPVHAQTAQKYIQTFFPLNGVFPQYLVWGFTVYDLMKKIGPLGADNWLDVFFHLKAICWSDRYTILQLEPGFLHIQERAIARFKDLLNGILIKEALGQTSSDMSLLMKVLWLFRSTVTVDYRPIPTGLGFKTQEDYQKFKEFVEFVFKLTRLGTNNATIRLPTFWHTLKWHQILPEKKGDCFKKMAEWYPKMVTSIATLIVTFCQESLFTMEGENVTPVRANWKGENVKPSNARPSTVKVVALDIYSNFFRALFMPFAHKVVPDINFILDTLTALTQKLHKDLFQPKDKDNIPLTRISKLGEKLESLGFISAKNRLFALFKAMEGNLKGAPGELLFHLKDPKESQSLLGILILETADPFALLGLFQKDILNLEGILIKLNAFREKNLKAFETFCAHYDEALLAKHKETVIDIAEEIHLYVSDTIISVCNLLFGLRALQLAHPLVFTDLNTFNPPDAKVLPLSQFIAFIGAQKKLKNIIANKIREKRPVKTLPKVVTQPMVSSSSVAASVQNPPLLPEEVTLVPIKKPKKKTRPANSQQTQKLQSKSSQPEKTEPTPIQVEKDELPTSKKLGALVDWLEARGHVFLQAGRGPHMKFINPADPKKQIIPLSHGSRGDDVSDGVFYKTIKRAHEAKQRASKTKK